MIFCSDLGEAYLKIIGVTTEDDGVYTCIAANDMGSISTKASLRVLGKFTCIISQHEIKNSTFCM